MKNVAALTAASFLVLLVACAPERPVSGKLAETPSVEPEAASVRSFPSHTAAPGGEARDAREAAEDAARRIADATLNAATRLREVGAGAVQAMQSGKERLNTEQAPAEVADANPVAVPQSVPASN